MDMEASTGDPYAMMWRRVPMSYDVIVEASTYDLKVSKARAPIDPLADNVTTVEFRSAFQVLAQAITAQNIRDVVVPVNSNMGTSVSRVRDFIRMNPPKIYGSKVEEDPQEFIDEVYKILDIMGVAPVKKVELPLINSKELLIFGSINGRRQR
ncbi:hypothetical protein MTR67_043388 [Solanum verrucosum]|uniref:Gag-pol polyprotein n=1 Tax=Solanum verrucosum TaxID=315347 RepID=A0AAF0UNM7_SOLVR|nr:hypothetical protein MTR67_043388 [Solanum verrucosum]